LTFESHDCFQIEQNWRYRCGTRRKVRITGSSNLIWDPDKTYIQTVTLTDFFAEEWDDAFCTDSAQQC
jgi:hypothetical protein